VWSGRGLCDELITRPEESYRLCCVSECDREALIMRRPWVIWGCFHMGEKLLMNVALLVGFKYFTVFC
jgi:hypothetical protein